MAPGPGNWITAADAHNLHRSKGLPLSFANPRWTPLAAKLRVIEALAPDCHERLRELDATQADNWQRPFKMWHYRAYFSVLVNTEKDCKTKSIKRKLVQQAVKDSKGSSFQHVAEQMIVDKLSSPYYAESRVRGKLVRWGLKGVPAHLERNVSAAFDILKLWCNPRVQVPYFRTIWNGWVRYRRMNTLVSNGRDCVLGCGWDEDSIEHYSVCSVF